MLLALRSLWEAVSSTGASHKNRKIQRKLRRLAQWSDNVVAPPRIDVVIFGTSLPALIPLLISGSLAITRHVAVYSKGVLHAGLAVADFIGVSVSVETPEVRDQRSEVKSGEIETKIDLLEDEYLALALIAA